MAHDPELSLDCRRAKHGRCARPRCECVCHKASPRWQGLTRTGQELATGDVEPGAPIMINCHGHHDDPGLCADCVAELRLVLADVPGLLDELDVAIAGTARFVERGVSALSKSDDGPGGHPAVAAQQRIVRALELVGEWFDVRDPERLAAQLSARLNAVATEPVMVRVARDLSSAAARAHKVIERPRDLWFYGPCPDCGRDIWQDRIGKDDHDTEVVCRFPSCGYAQPVAEHHRRQLAAAEDRWMTVTELVSAFELAGEPVTRDQINGWARRDGLPREGRPVLKWVDGELQKTGEVFTHRVGDVMDMMVRAQTRRGRLVS